MSLHDLILADSFSLPNGPQIRLYRDESGKVGAIHADGSWYATGPMDYLRRVFTDLMHEFTAIRANEGSWDR